MLIKFMSFVLLALSVNKISCNTKNMQFIKFTNSAKFSTKNENFLIRTLKVNSLLECGIFCSKITNCYIFSFYIEIDSNFNCKLFPLSVNFDLINNSEDNSNYLIYLNFEKIKNIKIALNLFDNIYTFGEPESKKQNSTLKNTTYITSTITNESTRSEFRADSAYDFNCINGQCVCKDNSSYFSNNQNKCLKCRNGWSPYKNICYRVFSDQLRWSDYNNWCSLLKSRMIMPQDDDKFQFFKKKAEELSKLTKKQRTWVAAVLDQTKVYRWVNNAEVKKSFINPQDIPFADACVAYYQNINTLLSATSCLALSFGICEYSE
ncbi:unnamed protein product [Brachionus calyciflorus]|uniref:C-type lectin domain-containing protein n=1 Tax=Brachionus calyciflorus TaxID=104777 RepID=A0A814K9I6_9BILA|nr:unnamed protein product [Brachionus calyciflorus]